MPEQSSWLEDLRASIQADTTLSAREQERRLATLSYIDSRTQHEGTHVARPHANRARQFMPFAALKGYHDLARARECEPEPKRAMTDELAAELSEAMSQVTKGCVVSVVHYEGDRYITTCGMVTRIDETFRSLSIIKKQIAFDDILSIEISD